jgi:glycosyltransferase involved in cell wall biosynthesis
MDPSHGLPRVLLLSWRDSTHPEAGGSERYVEEIARGLAARGARVTIFCAAHRRAPAGETRDGVRFVRRGGHLTVYLHGLRYAARTRPDVVVDVQNGIPFFSRLVVRRPVVLLHHVHREQWPVVFGPRLARLGWWLESRLAPRLYRGCRYVTVSEATRTELGKLGIGRHRVTVIPNGADPLPAATWPRSPVPRLAVVGRLVPQKRVEHAVEAVARLRERWPDLHLDVVGQGWWSDQIRAYARGRGVADAVTLHGWVDEPTKHEILAASWVHLCPSVKEGWGIAVIEAAAHGVPTVAYRDAGGTAESVRDGVTGMLAGDLAEFVAQVEVLLARGDLRAQLGAAARAYAATFRWDATARAFAAFLGLPGGIPAPGTPTAGSGTAAGHRSQVPVPRPQRRGDHEGAPVR